MNATAETLLKRIATLYIALLKLSGRPTLTLASLEMR